MNYVKKYEKFINFPRRKFSIFCVAIKKLLDLLEYHLSHF